jgi:hypothetical protein
MPETVSDTSREGAMAAQIDDAGYTRLDYRNFQQQLLQLSDTVVMVPFGLRLSCRERD